MDNRNEILIGELVDALTLDEKIRMIHGTGLFHTGDVKRLGIPPLIMSDGPMGVRNEFEDNAWKVIGHTDDFVSYLPCNSALAATWNRELAKEAGKVLGEEARGRGKDVILAPGINIKRSPLCGRNFEYMSEDPYLTGEMAVPLIQGIQTADTAACVKHFALNNQETERLWVEPQVSERALREIYLPAFEKAVKEGNSYSLMAAYNRYKGEHCCESKALLNGVLRKEWGYDGMVVSDWGGVHKTEEAASSGLDIEMSVTDDFESYCMAAPLKEALENGRISEELINEKIRNILRLMLRLHMLGDITGDQKERTPGSYNTPKHHKAVLDAARESVVLLKNEKGLLPLAPEKIKKVLLVGDNADRVQSNGGGSAEIKALYEITPLMGIKMLLGGNARVDFAQGYYADNFDHMNTETNWQADSLENGGGTMGEAAKTDPELLKKQDALRAAAVKTAAEGDYDAVIFVGGQNHFQDLEGHDRPDMKLPYAQDKLLEELLSVKPDTIVILVSGSPVEMPWISRVNTLVWHWYAGMEGGSALAEVLFGKTNPSGRLPETFPITHLDCPAHCIGEFPGGETVKYSEGVFVGYRYYNTAKIPVLFPFGYGLSYTEFAYSNLKIEGDYPKITVSVDVANIGSMAGKETVQIYVGREDIGSGASGQPEEASLHVKGICLPKHPARELRAFAKLELQPGETKTAVFCLTPDAFHYFDEQQGKFVTTPGTYRIFAGKSVEDICLAQTCRIQL